MANDYDDAAETGPAPASRGRTRLFIGIVLFVLAGLVGGYLWRSNAASHAADSKASAADAKPEIYLSLEPAFVVTFREGDSDSLRYLQVGVTLMSHDQAAITVAKDADPVVRDSLVALFSSQRFDVVSEAAGREKLQVDALAAVRKIVQKRMGRPGIEALYFTSFVIQ